ncbi:hypothetical protein [Actinomadura sp. 9N215]|uniref:hypothetical protein n=1 Tax=Actinomadura sp. 9N215 TaxID=3375150 RepID=UPI0037B09E7E
MIFGNNVGGSIKINGKTVGSGVYVGDKQLRCDCGNTDNWASLTQNGNSAEGRCGDCGSTAKID